MTPVGMLRLWRAPFSGLGSHAVVYLQAPGYCTVAGRPSRFAAESSKATLGLQGANHREGAERHLEAHVRSGAGQRGRPWAASLQGR